ncbi:MAG: cytochrome C oxidase subunit IV family protein [Bacteroidota bacterium]|nr:cytochrome C oxidase subunit IV family protein [Bacteroidota bacterium]MDE2834842.1 cytochrome C oxidase subunit IV family protein [Bacteroidota bacterium]MDE2957070.1 cytochrome C oxidase subunit IV family protein [Bacteroidota bacterium]
MAQGHHIIPIRTLAVVFAVLVALTIITVITARIELGVANVPLALAIAGSKALLVAIVFMALKYDNQVNVLVLSLGVLFAVVFLSLTLADTELRGVLGITDAGTTVIAVEAEEVLQEEPVPVAAYQAPEEVYQRYCITCHSLDGTVGVGPSLTGLTDRQPPDSILQSIMDPDVIVVSGYTGLVMQATLNGLGFYTNVSDASVDSLIAWLGDQ